MSRFVFVKMITTSSKFNNAVGELLKEVCDKVETKSLEVAEETLESLKKLSVGSDALAQSIASMKGELIKSNNEIIKVLNAQDKDRRMEWALANSSIGCFDYYERRGSRKSTAALVQTVLMYFRRGSGCSIDNISTSAHFDQESQQACRDALVTQLHGLLGSKPRVVLQADNRFAIYYS
jgi:hypothetical protein